MMAPAKSAASEVTQPPLFAWVISRIFLSPPDRVFLKEAYPRLKKYLRWLYRNRDLDGDGLLEWKISGSPVCRCGESGLDNSPRFDHLRPGVPMAAIDLNCFAVSEMEHLADLAESVGCRPDAVRWRQEREKRVRLINERLWDEKDGLYYDRDRNGRRRKVKTAAVFLPLWAGVADPDQAARLVEHLENKRQFASPFPVPSTAMDDPAFTDDMWRGPVWINCNYLVIEGLRRYGYRAAARRIALKTLREIARWYGKRGVFFEYYDPFGKKAPDRLRRKEWLGGKSWTKAISDYHWTAAIYVVLAHELFGGE